MCHSQELTAAGQLMLLDKHNIFQPVGLGLINKLIKFNQLSHWLQLATPAENDLHMGIFN